MKTSGFIAFGLMFGALACGGSATVAKEEVSAEATSEALTSVTTVGTLTSGKSITFSYTSKPTYRAINFVVKADDKVSVDVKSTNGGDSVAWIIDKADKVVAFNDDYQGSLDSHIDVTLKTAGTYRIIVRDYDYLPAKFTASLTIKSAAPVDMYACKTDADCVKVFKGCCDYQGNIAVNASSADAYKNSLGCSTPQICPKIAVKIDPSAALCNTTTSKCELVQPGDIACGGRSLNPHQCPAGYRCMGDAQMHDGPGKCLQECGGIAGLQCSDSAACVDDWTDGCDPNKGGADCGGVCHTCGKVAFKCAAGYHVDWAACGCSRDVQ